jgi:hypothetical protein
MQAYIHQLHSTNCYNTIAWILWMFQIEVLHLNEIRLYSLYNKTFWDKQ